MRYVCHASSPEVWTVHYACHCHASGPCTCSSEVAVGDGSCTACATVARSDLMTYTSEVANDPDSDLMTCTSEV